MSLQSKHFERLISSQIRQFISLQGKQMPNLFTLPTGQSLLFLHIVIPSEVCRNEKVFWHLEQIDKFLHLWQFERQADFRIINTFTNESISICERRAFIKTFEIIKKKELLAICTLW